jgi:uncharacterized protein (TIGR02466 family)
MNNGQIKDLFPTRVGFFERTDISDHELILDAIKDAEKEKLEIVSNSDDKHVLDFIQTDTGFDEKISIKLKNFVKDCVYNYAIGCNYSIQYEDLYIADCWANYSKGTVTTHTPHIHSNSLFSVVYYLSAPKGSGSLYFMHPNMQVNSLEPDPRAMGVENSSEFAIEPNEGLCVVFKSNTIHGTSANSIEYGHRANIAFTFNVKNLGKRSIMSHYERNNH